MTLPVVLNLATLTGFVVVICVVGGQCLSAVSDGSVTPSVGIVVIALLSLLISFCGFRVLHWYESCAWIPALVAIAVAVGCGANGLARQASVPAPEAGNVISFGMIVAGYMISWAAIASDLTTYFDPDVPS